MNLQPLVVSPGSLGAMRIGLGLAVVRSSSHLQTARPNGRPTHPVGLARLIDLTWVADRRAWGWLRSATLLAAMCYVADVLPFAALVTLSAALLLQLTHRFSFGYVNHGHHLLLTVVIVQTLALATWRLADGHGWHPAALGASASTTAAWWSVQAILAVYFTSGVTKLLNTRGTWISRSPGLLLQHQGRRDTELQLGPKRRRMAARSSGLVEWLLDHQRAAAVLFAGGLAVELATPLGLLNDGTRLLVGLSLVALHQANDRLLGLPFIEFQLIVVTFLVVPYFFT